MNLIHSCLLEDANAERREAVRMKTEKYLLKAEELYHKHLSATEIANAPNRWGISAVSFNNNLNVCVSKLTCISQHKEFTPSLHSFILTRRTVEYGANVKYKRAVNISRVF